MLSSVQKMTYSKACACKRVKIKKAEDNVQVTGFDYLQQVRYATFISLKHGQESQEYKKALEKTKKALGRYMKALEHLYDSINWDIKEILD